MRHVRIRRHGLFTPLVESGSVQAASMVLRPGESSSDEPENEHPRSEQWVFVVSGTGKARVGGRSMRIREGSLLLIEKRERHRITATGRASLVTLNFYAPPAYGADGQVKPSARRR